MLILLNIMHTIFCPLSNELNWFAFPKALEIFVLRTFWTSLCLDALGSLYRIYRIFMCILWSIYFHLCMHVLAQFVSIINDEYRTERKCTKILTKPANNKHRASVKKTTRYCEFCSITTIDKLQSMWKLGQPLYNRLEFVTSTKHVLWAKANEWAFTRLPISFYALSKHFSFRSHPMHACKKRLEKRLRIVYLNLIANRSIYHGNSVHASVRQMQMQTMRPYIYIEIRCAQVKYIIHRHRCEWIQCAWVLCWEYTLLW